MRLEEGSWQAEAVRSQLAAGEKLRWMGAPAPWRSMGPRMASFFWGLVFAAIVTGAAVGAANMAHQPLVGLVVALVFVPFNFAALRGLSSPLRGFMAARATVYAVSDRRLIFLFGRYRTRIESFDAAMLPVVQPVPRGEGGSLVFPGVALSRKVAKLNGGHKTGYRPLGLYHLSDREAAESALRSLRAQVPAGAARPKGSELGVELVLPWPRGFDGERLAPDDALRALLMPDEHLRWSCRPEAPAPGTVQGTMAVGGVLAAFALLVAILVPKDGLPLSGACFVGGVLGCIGLAGLYMLAAPKWMPAQLVNIRYAISDRRLIVMEPKGRRKLTLASYVPPSLYVTRVMATPGGGGALVVRCDDYVRISRTYDASSRSYRTQTRMATGSVLQGLPDLAAAQGAIAELQAGTPLEQAVTIEQPLPPSAALERTVPFARSTLLAAALASFAPPGDFPADLLQPGETVRWLGRPTLPVTAWQIVIGFLGTLPLLQLILGALGALAHGDLMGLLGSADGWPVIVIAILAAAWPWACHLTARSTLYAVTNQRALALVGGPGGRRLRVFPRAALATRVRVARGEGGDLTFSPDALPPSQLSAIATSTASGSQQAWSSLFDALKDMLPFSKGFVGVSSLADAEAAIARLLDEPAEQSV